MKTDLTYNEAYVELEKIVLQIEEDEIQLDTLADKVKRAKELIEFCEAKLRTVESTIQDALGEDGKTTRKKN